MSDKAEEKTKRGYKVGGKALSYDLRVRLDADTAQRLEERARKDGTTRAETAREILKKGLSRKK